MALRLEIAQERDLPTLLSAFSESPLNSRESVLEWLARVKARQSVSVERISFEKLDQWRFSQHPLTLAHDSGRFFTIEGIRTTTNYGPVCLWDQPIINQPEIGILGILTRVVDGVRHYLMQAKAEPGNIDGPQISPTLQATRSNYTKVHRGLFPKYLEYFTGERPARVLVDQLQSEQGSRFLGKRNRNIILEVDHEVAVEEGFRWMTLGEIKRLLKLDHVVNMDARSVLSCIPLPTWKVIALGLKLTDFGSSLLDSVAAAHSPASTLPEILNWLSRMRSTYRYQVARRGLNELKHWILTDSEISHREGHYFSVIAARIENGGREVNRWTQPLLFHPGKGLNGMVSQKIGGVLHFLIRASFYPGNREMFELGSTVSRSDYMRQFSRPDAPPFLELFRDPAPSTVRFSSVQSEEGGRFFRYQNQYTILELPPDTIGPVPEGFMWMTLGRIQELIPHSYFNIEARNLFACLHLS